MNSNASVSRVVTLAWTVLAISAALFATLAAAVEAGLTASPDRRIMLAFHRPDDEAPDEAIGPS